MSILGAKHILKGLKFLNKNTLKSIEDLAQGSAYSINALMHSEQNFTGAISYQLAAHYGYKHALCGANFLPYSLILANKKKKNLYI